MADNYHILPINVPNTGIPAPQDQLIDPAQLLPTGRTTISIPYQSNNKNNNLEPNVVNFSNTEGTPHTMAIGIVTTANRYMQIRPASIKQLVLVDNALNPFHDGYLVIDNSVDILERHVDAINEQKSSDDSPARGFLFKGDARDFIYIDIFPNLTTDAAAAEKDDQRELINKYFRINLQCAVYNTEDIIDGETPGIKFKKLYFRDLYAQILHEKSSFYSTTNFCENKDFTNISNAQRAIPTHTAIKTFLESFFNQDDGYPATVTIDKELFDTGSSRIFFSSPANFKGIDTLTYLLEKHTSSAENNYDFALLELDRCTRTFTLESVTSIFKKALQPSSEAPGTPGPYYLETFLLGGYTDFFHDEKQRSAQLIRYAPYQNVVFMKTAGVINNFTYDMMPGEHTQNAVNASVVHSYNYNNKEFSMDIIENTYDASHDVYAKNYVQTLNNTFNTNFSPGVHKKISKNYRNAFTVKTDDEDISTQAKFQRFSSGRNKFLKSSIFLNQAVSFKVPGSTHRQTNRFMGVTRNTSLPISEFDQKMLGTYYITEVKHIFAGGEYANEIKAVKTYTHANLYTGDVTGI